MNIDSRIKVEQNMEKSLGGTNTTEDDSEGSYFNTSDDDDESYDSDESSIASNYLEEEKAKNCEKKSGLFLSLAMVEQLRMSTSEGNLNRLIQDESVQKMIPRCGSSGTVNAKKGKVIYAVQTKSPMESHFGHENEISAQKPKELLISILNSNNIQADVISYNSLPDTLFVQGNVAGYSLDLMTAVKKGDIDYIRHLHKTKKSNFQCCNKFGESIIHAAARQGHVHILKYLVNKANVSMRVRCDTGRTPLHDACWSGMPNFDNIDFIIETCPEFLLIQDKKGFTPLEYAPKDTHWHWSEYLEINTDKIIKLLKEYQLTKQIT